MVGIVTVIILIPLLGAVAVCTWPPASTEASGEMAACPNCGQMFETPTDPDEPAPPASRRGRDERGFADAGGYGRRAPPGHSGLGVASFIIGLVVIVLVLLVIVLTVVMAAIIAVPTALAA